VADLLARLFAMDAIAVLLEGGASLNAAFLDAGAVDRAAFFVAPIVLGGVAAPGAVAGMGHPLREAIRLTGVTARSVGQDWLLEGDVALDQEPGSCAG
jgi:diaminohydroxyphosphoribosylaminopyrimidine deaminase / 5-amino-6-(5-phosphoribosylamino)uracil reductase